jgi:hypothetical protein
MKLKSKIYTLRTIHIFGALFMYFSVGVLIYSALTGKNPFILKYSLGVLTLEAFAIMINKWDCPLHPIHKKLGDEKAIFGLFMPLKHTRKAMVISILLGVFAGLFWGVVNLIN